MNKSKTQYRDGPETARLLHRAMEPRDAPEFFRLNSHPEVMRLTGDIPLGSVADARQAILNYADFDEVGYGRWACILKSSQAMIGFCGLKYLPEFDEVDVGYRLFPEFWGRGLATEACVASLKFGFETLQLDRIIGLAMPENRASIRVLQKSGMVIDGEVETEGVLAVRYSITRNRFLAIPTLGLSPEVRNRPPDG